MILDIGDVTRRETKPDEPKPHEIAFGVVYMNNLARAAFLQSPPRSFAEGAVIVREKLKKEATSPELLAVMIKRRFGFNPLANDWEFLILNGNATKIKKREKTWACQRCHASADSGDSVFAVYAQSFLPINPTVAPQ